MLKCCAAAAAAPVSPPQRRRRGHAAPPGARRETPVAVRCSAVSSSAAAAVTALAGDGTSYREKFSVRCCEVGPARAATVQAIANLLQEAGCNHVQSLGFSTDGFATTMTMRKLRLIWVTTRMHIEMNKYPAWGDVIEIETWCQEEGRIGIRRDWILKDMATDSVIGRAASKFVMMNQDSRKLHRVTDEVREECLAFRSGAPRFAFSQEDSCSSKKISKLQYPAQHLRLGLEPRRADLDMNLHASHVTYIGWALESIPQEIIDTHQLQKLTLDYKRECYYNSVVDSLSIPQEIIDTHQLQKLTLDYKRECYYNSVVDSLASMEVGEREEELIHPNGNNGSATTKQQSHCQFLHFLRLSSTGLEISRGRTEWRKLVQ